MNCTECKNIIEKYLDGMIEPAELDTLKQHVDDCVACRKEFESVGNIESLLKEALTGGIDAAPAKDEILSKIASGQIKSYQSTYRSGRWASVAAGIVLAAGILLGLGLSKVATIAQAIAQKRLQVPMKVSSFEGTVLVKHKNSKMWEQLQPQAKVYLGDAFHSTAKSKAELTFDNGSTMKLNPNSTLTLKLYNGQTEFYLKHGVVSADLRSPHGPFFISTPHGRVEALGTEFTVSVE